MDTSPLAAEISKVSSEGSGVKFIVPSDAPAGTSRAYFGAVCRSRSRQDGCVALRVSSGAYNSKGLNVHFQFSQLSFFPTYGGVEARRDRRSIQLVSRISSCFFQKRLEPRIFGLFVRRISSNTSPLQILTRGIILDSHGESIQHELNRPVAYLRLVQNLSTPEAGMTVRNMSD